MLLAELSDWISDDEFLDGFVIVNSLPGPLYNFSAYLGGIISGWYGALVCWIALYIPGFFFMYSILQLWVLLKDKPFIKKTLVYYIVVG
jgi:chromate transporter